jgi:hypothetical protein
MQPFPKNVSRQTPPLDQIPAGLRNFTQGQVPCNPRQQESIAICEEFGDGLPESGGWVGGFLRG